MRTTVPDRLDTEPNQVGGTEQLHRSEHSDRTFDDDSEPGSNQKDLDVDTNRIAGNGDERGLSPKRNCATARLRD